MNIIYEKINRLRILLFNYQEIVNIPDDLLILMLSRNYNYDNDLNNILMQKYGSNNYQRLEFLGDSVIDLIISDILYNNYSLLTPHVLTTLRSKIVNNVSLACLANNQQLCQLIISNQSIQIDNKTCADGFEAIIGGLYWYLKQINYNDPLNFISYWLNDLFKLYYIIDYLIENTYENNVCNVILTTNEKNQQSTFKNLYLQQQNDEQNDELIDLRLHVDDKIIKEREKLTELLEDELKIKMIAIQRELALKTALSYKTQLDNYYKKYKLGKPIYSVKHVGGRGIKWGIHIICPKKSLCNDNIIGIGYDFIKKNAEEEAAKNALIFLKNDISI